MRIFLSFLTIITGFASGFAAEAQSSPKPEVTRGAPVEEQGFSHGRVCLNGVWNFQPIPGKSLHDPVSTAWGLIRVPGSWTPLVRKNFPGVVKTGAGEPWKNWDGATVSQAWYERPITIPKEWAGRAILLDFRRVSTAATVYLNGRKVGSVSWPSGRVDITDAVKAGETYKLRVLVSAAMDREKTLNAMGVGQNTMVASELATRGIIGEVFLVSRPKGPRIESVWVRTSVRKHELTVEADLTDVTTTGPVEFHAEVRNPDGTVARTFDARADVAAGSSTVTLTWPWADPKLWDVGQPNLYTLDLVAKGKNLNAGFSQTFGFREVWVKGRKIFLNGSEFRMRPTSSLPEGQYTPNNGNVTVLKSALHNIREAGFNCVELWPSDFTVPGTFEFNELVCDLADRAGMPIMGPTRSAVEMFGSWHGMKWENPEARAEWKHRMEEEWKRYRNNPSIIIWASSGNIAGHAKDQDPRRIGRSMEDPAWKTEKEDNAGWWNFMSRLQEMIDFAKELDPTRPYMIHSGGPVGDIYSLNNYLDLIPLQEREEWLSDWAQTGTLPYCAVEFGTPLSTTMNRGRDGFVFSTTTEWLMTEFSAIYLGREAYELEESEYRDAISGPNYLGGQLWGWPDLNILDYAPAFQQLEKLFITNTWRSWRTMGISGGMIPWASGHGFEPVDADKTIALPPFKPGQRGTWFPRMAQHALHPFGGPGMNVTPAGKALLANNTPTLAWITGPEIEGDIASFTAKDHSFFAGSKVSKRVALLNDSRARQPWSVKVTVSLDGKTLTTVEKSGSIAVGQTLYVPVDFTAPKNLAGKTDGVIALEAKIGDAVHADRFAYRVFPPLAPLTGTVSVFDPAGDTTKLLQRLGLTVKPWTGGPADVLVIGRKALSDEGKLPASLEEYARNGGRLLIMTQDPAWLKDQLGFRVCPQMSRRVFRLDAGHPIVAGLDDADLRNWSGFSTLLEGKPHYDKANGMPTWGWRWGGRGAVSSAAIEKPHRSGWRPLLECEFDLAYSPLMEMDFGKGRVTLCTLDLEDHAGLDPAALLLARNLLQWTMHAPLTTGTVQALYVGNDEGAKLLDLLGADYRHSKTVEPSAPLTILGPNISADAAAPALAAGGKVLVLPRLQAGPAGLGLTVVQKKDFGGSLAVPSWTEARGLSPSDLRWRCDGPALILEGRGAGAGGLLARVVQGKGVAIFSQSNPLTIPADKKQYFRYTRWRMTRTLSQLVANLGGRFAQNRRIFTASNDRIALDGKWKVAWTNKMAPAPAAFPDPGISDEAKKMVKADADETGMDEILLPSFWPKMSSADGEAVFRRHFNIPAGMLDKPLVASLGTIDDFDSTYINGVKIGSTGKETASYWSTPRTYAIPPGLLKEGDNVIAVRVFDNFSNGGFGGVASGMTIAPASAQFESFYYPDYRSDFKLGDDPYRYYRW